MNAEGAPLIVYCEIGAVTKVVKDLIDRGVIQIIHGPYEGRLKRAIPAMPSRVTADSTWFTSDSTFRISDLEHSSNHSDIVRIIGSGKRTRMDALHLDSAHKSGAAAFLTPDKHDIVRHRVQLEALLGLRIFHLNAEDEKFRTWANSEYARRLG
jgi:hypothetical protein